VHTATHIDVPSIGRPERSLYPIDDPHHNDSNGHVAKLSRFESPYVVHKGQQHHQTTCLSPAQFSKL